MPTVTARPKLPGKLGAEKLTPEERRRQFIEAAREAGAGENEAALDANLERIARPKALDSTASPTAPRFAT